MLSLYDFQRKPSYLSDRLPWMALAADNPCVLQHKDGSLQHSLRLQLPATATWTENELLAHAARLNNVLRRLGTGWGLFLEITKYRQHPDLDSACRTAAGQVAAAERARYFQTTPHFGLDTTATLVWLPRAIREQRAWRWLTRGSTEAQHQEVITPFQEQVERFADRLTSCVREVQPLGPKGTLTYLHGRVSTSRHPVAVPDPPAHLDCYLTDRDYVPGMHPALIIGARPDAPAHGPWQKRFIAQHLRTLSVTGWPGETYTDMLSALLLLPCEWTYVVRWLPLDSIDAYKIMKDKVGKWRQARQSLSKRALRQFLPLDEEGPAPDREALQKQTALEGAMDACMQGETYGYLNATVTTWDTDPDAADVALRDVDRVITSKGFSCHPEHLNATEAWLGSLPGLCYPNVRRPLLSSRNLAHCWLSGVDTGTPWDTHLQAPALGIVETASRIPYHLVLHDHGMGHALVIGSGGTGKTTFVGTLALWFERYHAQGARVRLIDKKEGLAPVTQAVGGDHYTLRGDGSGVNFQPLREIDDETERQWAAAWVETLCAQQQQVCAPTQRRELWEALCGLAGLAPQHRTLTSLVHLVQDTGLRQAIRPYTMEGAYGRVLDAVTPPLSLSPWACFETDALFQVTPLVGPTLGVLFHQLARTFQDKVPTCMVLDEAWKYLAVLQFREQIDEWLRELRKLHVNLIFSTQDPLEILTSPIAPVLKNQCKIRVFLPNPQAPEKGNVEAYMEMGLNARQIDLLAQALPHRDYLLMTPHGVQMIDLALGPQQLNIITKGAF